MTDYEIILNRAESAVISRDYSLAARLYKSLLEKNPDDETLLLKMGNLYVKSGKDSDALPYFEKLVQKNPDSCSAILGLGGVFRRLKRYNESIEILTKALDNGITSPEIVYSLGFTYKFTGDYTKAIECFRSVIEENPNDVLAYNHIGSIYALQKEPEEAIGVYRRGLKIDPNHPVLNYNLAKSFEELNQNDNAASAYRAALRSRPGWPEAIESYTKLLLRTQHRKTAERLISQTLGLNPRNPNLHILLGNCLAAQSDYASALECYKKALEISPELDKALSGAALMSEKLGMNLDSVDFMQKLEKIAPDNVDFILQYAYVLLSARQYDEALEKINSVLEKNPKNLQALNLLGQYHLCNGEYDKAEEVYGKIAKINHNYVDYLRDAAFRLKQNEKFEKANEYIEKYKELKPTEPSGLLLYAQLCEVLEDAETALGAYHRVLKYDRYNAIALQAVRRLGEIVTDANARKFAELQAEAEVVQEIPADSDSIDEEENSFEENFAEGKDNSNEEEFSFPFIENETPAFPEDEEDDGLKFSDEDDEFVIDDEDEPVVLPSDDENLPSDFDIPAGIASPSNMPHMDDLKDDDLFNPAYGNIPKSHSDMPQQPNIPQWQPAMQMPVQIPPQMPAQMSSPLPPAMSSQMSPQESVLKSQSSGGASQPSSEVSQPALSSKNDNTGSGNASGAFNNPSLPDDSASGDSSEVPLSGENAAGQARSVGDAVQKAKEAVDELAELARQIAGDQISAYDDDSSEPLAETEEPAAESGEDEACSTDVEIQSDEMPDEKELSSELEDDGEDEIETEQIVLPDSPGESVESEPVESEIIEDEPVETRETESAEPEADSREAELAELARQIAGDQISAYDDEEAEQISGSDEPAENDLSQQDDDSSDNLEMEDLPEMVENSEASEPDSKSDEPVSFTEASPNSQKAEFTLDSESNGSSKTSDGLLSKMSKLVDSDKPKSKAEKNAELLKLFKEVNSLSDHLSSEKKEEFLKSRNGAQLGFVLEKFERKPGLLSSAEALRKASYDSLVTTGKLQDIPLSGKPLANAVVEMMNDLSGSFTDKSLTTAMDSLCDEIKAKMDVL